MVHFCGLDFGTSNSTIATVRDSESSLIPLEGENLTLPSTLFYDGASASVSYGREAIELYLEGEDGRLMRSIKSLLGTDLINTSTHVSDRQIPFKSVISKFLSEMKDRAEARLGAEIDSIVQGRPVNFVDDDERANADAKTTLEEILRSIGFKHIEFQYEPIAAGQYFASTTTHECLCLIVDIGGGTSDFSLINISPAKRKNARIEGQVIANAGIRIGGTNFDQVLSFRHIMPLFGLGAELSLNNLDAPRWIYSHLSTWSKINTLHNPKTRQDIDWTIRNGGEDIRFKRLGKVVGLSLGHHVASSVEDAKIALSTNDHTLIDLSYIEKELSRRLSARSLADHLAEPIARIDDAIEACLRQGGLTAANVDAVILTGGSTEMPVVQNSIRSLFPHADIRSCDTFGAVGIGLAMEAGSLFG